jgi:hypothetical protein
MIKSSGIHGNHTRPDIRTRTGGAVGYLKLSWALLIPRRTLSSRIVVARHRAGSFLDSAFHHVCLATHDGATYS